MHNSKDYHKQYYQDHKEEIKSSTRAYWNNYRREYMRNMRAGMSPEEKEAHLLDRRVKAKELHKKNPSLRKKQNIRTWLRKWGVPEDEVFSMAEDLWLRKQGACELCGRPQETTNALHVDHCHKTNSIRGVICHFCNTGLGHFKDDPDLLRRAAMYVEDNGFKKP